MSAEVMIGPQPKAARRGRWAERKRALEHGLFGFIPVIATLGLLAFQFKINAVALDFRVAYWPAVSRLLHGLSPYAVSHHQLVHGMAFVYPALSAVALAPFGLVSNAVGQVLWTVVCIACIPATLYVLEVRDWRVYGLVMLWAPVFVAWQSGNETMPLALAVALAWRHRDRPIVAGLVTAAALSMKPFVWPLGLWLLVTRRWRAAGWALAGGILTNLVAWWIVGFGAIRTFLRLSSEDTQALWHGGYSVMAVAHHLGLGFQMGVALLVALSAVALIVLTHAGFIRHRDREALVLAVLLMLLASPLVWSHYFALLLVPLAFARPRLSPAWGIGLLMWRLPPRLPVYGWEEAVFWALAAICIGLALRDRPTRTRLAWAGGGQRPQQA